MARVGAAVVAGIVFGVLGAGCAAPNGATRPPATAATAPAGPVAAPDLAKLFPAPPLDEKSLLTLEQITPPIEMPKPRARDTSKPAPLEALELFARGRAALIGGQRLTAVSLLEKASGIDPDSPEIYEELGRAYGGQEKSAWAYEQALELDPDNLEVRERLGRHYHLRNKPDEALKHFRLAVLTTQYKEDEEAAAVVDFFLARVLQKKGYDRAALDAYARLAKRLELPATARSSNQDLLTLQSQPELTYAQMGELYERFGQWVDAVKAYEVAVGRAPENFDVQARLTRALLAAGRPRDAETRAAEVVVTFRASSDSLKLMRDVFKAQNREGEMTEELRRMQEKRPGERPLLFAVADALRADGKGREAEEILLSAAKKSSDSATDILRRVFDLYTDRGDTESAVRLLVEALADRPETLRELAPMWAELLRPSRSGGQVRLPTIQRIKVEPKAEAARLFWVSRIAELWDRDALARAALEQAATQKPAFAPVYRALVSDYWSRADWDDAAKIAAVDRLVRTAREQGDAALAAELDGLSLLNQSGKSGDAAARLAEAVKLGSKSPDVILAQARAAKLDGSAGRAESLIWRVISDWPTCEDAYVELFNEYLSRGDAAKAINVLTKWLAADPTSIRGRLLRARVMQRAGQGLAAESELRAVFRDQPDNAQVLSAMYDYYFESRRIEEFVSMLEEQRGKNEGNREAAEQLVMIYHKRGQADQALRVLDGTRKAVAGDADLTYYVAHVYGRIGQKQTEEDLLGEVMRIDPRHAPAANDLGYSLADAGKDMSKAEELVRVAVEAEPDNQSFLDSMGWVLYKRGKFAEARGYFERAIGPAARPDPVVLDHMGDVLYRLSENDGAVKQWKRAMQRLDESARTTEREDLKKLRLQLIQKLRQHEKGDPVEVAPVAEAATAKQSAVGSGQSAVQIGS